MAAGKETPIVSLSTEKDYAGIVRISEGVYDGFDYLPCIYHEWLKDEKRVNATLRIGDEIVGFGSCLAVDNFSSMVMQGGRIGKGHRGKALCVLLLDYLEEKIKARYKTIRRVKEMCYVYAVMKNVEIVYDRRYSMSYKAEVDADDYIQKGFLRGLQEENLMRYNESKDCEYLLKHRLLDNLISDKIVPVDGLWVPLDLEPYNAKEISQHCVVLGNESVSGLREGKTLKSFSLGCLVEVVSFHMWNVQIFSDSQEQTVSHIKAHISHAFERFGEIERTKDCTIVFEVYRELVDTVKKVCEEEFNLSEVMPMIEFSGYERPPRASHLYRHKTITME